MKSIYPSGHLHTFDFHEDRANAARKEFQRHDCASVVSVQHKDVCKDGFNLINAADAVFLDLPMPWEALESAKTALKDEGKIILLRLSFDCRTIVDCSCCFGILITTK